MLRIITRISAVSASLVLLAGCAASPEVQERRAAVDADIQSILSMSVDAAGEPAEPERCLSELEYRDFRALDDQYLVFEGRRDRLWVNKLRTRCHDLRYGSIIRVSSFSNTRICDADRFVVSEWFEWPWYRRWPWHWTSTWGSGTSCTLGKFYPVTEGQVAEIEAALKR